MSDEEIIEVLARFEGWIDVHLDRVVKDGIDYRVKEALNKAIADSITPDVVSGYATAAVKAITDQAVTERIVKELHNAIGEGVRLVMEEAILSVASRIRGYQPQRNADDAKKIEELRLRLFPNSVAMVVKSDKSEPRVKAWCAVAGLHGAECVCIHCERECDCDCEPEPGKAVAP